jgi:hypothetical protein
MAVFISTRFLHSIKINGARIGKNQTRILREGNEIAFGTSVPQHHNSGLEDYRACCFLVIHVPERIVYTQGLYTVTLLLALLLLVSMPTTT